MQGVSTANGGPVLRPHKPAFWRSGTVALAEALLGSLLVREHAQGRLVGRIVETEAYPPGDAASHAFRGRSPRCSAMFLKPGHAYVYRSYGLHACLNVTSEPEGEGAAVLIRALEPLEGTAIMQINRAMSDIRLLARGPGRVGEAFDVDLALNGADVTKPGLLWVAAARSKGFEIGRSKRIGITKNPEPLWRFFIRGSTWLSGPAILNRAKAQDRNAAHDSSFSLPQAGPARVSMFALPLDTPPMEARLVAQLPDDEGPWQYEPKWDGFRCLVFKIAARVELRAKSGKSLNRYFPEVVDFFAHLKATDFVLDGELVLSRDDRLDFGALQMRLHPAPTRIKKLATETPARLMVFDLLVAPGGKLLVDQPLKVRREALERFLAGVKAQDQLALSPATLERTAARKWLGAKNNGTDGVVAKRLTDPYQPGERAMLKVKRLRTADCVVGGFRYEADSALVGSLLLGLYDENGLLDHVGYTSALSDAEKPALTRKLEKLLGGPGFTGKKPGGPSRWSTKRSSEWSPVKNTLVVEVRYDHVTDRRFRHGTTLLRWRPDKAPSQCTIAQIA